MRPKQKVLTTINQNSLRWPSSRRPAHQPKTKKPRWQRLPRTRPQKKPADALNEIEIKDKQVAALMSAWNKAGKEAREEFLRRIDSPLMDALA